MARLVFRPITSGVLGDFFGADFPPWVRALDGKSGVYVIRERRNDKRVLYVGECHTGRLKKTLQRHFQSWSGPTAGQTYSRGAVEVAVMVLPAGRALARQNKEICRLKPRDNTVSPACELPSDDPF